jgi:hypothetical protein
MKYVYPMGGLGNCLFHINLCYDLLNSENNVVLNTFFLRKNIITRILGFTFHNTEDNLYYFSDNRIKFDNSFSFAIANFIILHFLRIDRFTKLRWFGLNYPTLDEKKNTKHFFGYFQNVNKIYSDIKLNFLNYREKFISGIDSNLIEQLRNENNLLLHIRGGDKKSDDNFYFNYKNIEEFLFPFKKIFIITDDINSAQFICTNLNINFEILEKKSAIVDFSLLSISKNKFIARSSFSWWSAELSDDFDNVYQPNPYYIHVFWNPSSNIRRVNI